MCSQLTPRAARNPQWVLGGSRVGPQWVPGGSRWPHKDMEILQNVEWKIDTTKKVKPLGARGSDFERYSMTFCAAVFIKFHGTARPLKLQHV